MPHSPKSHSPKSHSPKSHSVLDLFHPLIRDWFRDEVGEPTEVQTLAWPRIAAGEHALVTAPTGSGKTLTAFLWALQQLLTGRWEGGQVRVLYVSPLRALNTDVRRNLAQPLAALSERFRAAGVAPPGIRAMTRSGDTPQNERQQMLRRPPEILITTPESLNILLTSRGGRSLLTGLETVIIDEIHAVAASKRGTHLMTAVERLVPLSGEFQRVALSATIQPLDVIAEFVGGFRLRRVEGAAGYVARPVTVVRSAAAKVYDVKVRFPGTPAAAPRAAGEVGGQKVKEQPEPRDEDASWELLVRDFKRVIRRNRSTLLFANSRRLTERVTRLLNQGEGEDLAYSHHGSLSREVRAVVEDRLKKGELRAIVATSSLELGIDVGALDEVLLIQTPRAVSSAVQRVGRAGHGVGEVSRGVLYPTFGRDFLDAAVVARALREQDIEEVRPILAPLDVLAQVILSMTASEEWQLDALYDALRTSYPYRHLGRRQLDLVIDMLAGRYADSRIRELRPRLSLDRVSQSVHARPGVARLIYMGGGTIADRGYFALRLQESMAKIGELDEEFVWERSVGDAFTLGAQSWQVRKITHNDVLVAPARGSSAMAPFWRADAQDRGFSLSRKIGDFLAWAEERLEDPELEAELRRDYALEPAAAAELLSVLKQQKAATGGRLPGSRHLLVERCSAPVQGAEEREQLLFHTFWGGTVNRPLAMALTAAWEELHPEPLEVFQDDDLLLLRGPRGLAVDEVVSLVDPEQVEVLLRRGLEKTGFFGARFRVAASTALLLPKAGFRTRTPLWMVRQRAKKLMESVTRYGDFPILVETWRSCLQDEFELEPLKRLWRQLREGDLPVIEVRTEAPSPFAANLTWRHTNQLMYEDDTPEARAGSGVRQDVLKELVFASHLRPRLPAELLERFRRKAQRTAPGYAPAPGDDLRDWLVERLLVPEEEWRELVEAVSREHGVTAGEVLAGVAARAAIVALPGAAPAVVAVDVLPRLLRARGVALEDVALTAVDRPGEPLAPAATAGLAALVAAAAAGKQEEGEEGEAGDAAGPSALAEVVGEWLRYQGPCDPQRLERVFGLAEEELREVLEVLQESQRVVIDELTRGREGVEVCDAENLEVLLRWLRIAARPGFEALPVEQLPLFLAHHQGVAARGDGVEALQERLERLFGLPAPARLWESEILPARLSPYFPAWLDALMQETDLCWLGCGKERVTFAFPDDLDLFREPPSELGESRLEPSALFPEERGRYDLGELAGHAGVPTAEASDRLWQLAWHGRVSNDTFLAVRKGVETKFEPAALPANRAAAGRASSRRAFNRWQSSRSFFGNWYLLPPPIDTGELDALDREELAKDGARVLLQRYGVLFRELLRRELPSLQWPRVFRALRLMELSGEVLAGHFFAGVRGLQFISHAAFRDLQRGLPQDAIFWLNAADPASLCGVDVEGLKAALPARKTTSHLVYHGTRLVLVSQRKGRELDVRVNPDHPHLGDYLEVLKSLLTRDVLPVKAIDVETINGEPALKSPYAGPLGEVFRVTRDARSLKLWKRY